MDNNDIRELTSCMSSICTFNLSNFLKNDFENTSVLLYNYLKKTKHYFDILRYIINTLETQHFFVLNGYKIFVANKYLFKLVLLMSIKHDKDIFDKKCKSVKLENIEDIIHLIIESYSANIHFIPVLRILDSLLKKYKNIIRHELCLDTFIFAQRISLCPIEGFKYYSQVISKHMLPYINSEYVNLFFDITFLPLRGLETSELIPFFSKKCNNEEFTKSLVFKVLNMFANNLESREGGFLYKAIMFMHFDDWKRLVWPHFYPKLISIDFEGEFFQSILKYWIPITLNTYKLDFYNYIYETSVPLCIKGQILLEIKSKTCFVGYSSKMVLNLNSLIMNKTYRFLGLQILSTFHKRTTYPVKDELQLFKLFLYSQMSELDNDHVKYVWRFLSHLSIVLMNMQSTNNVLDVNNFMIYLYMTFLKNIFNFASDLLNSGRPEFGAQILNIFWKLSQGEYNVRYKYISLSNCTMALDEMSYVKLSETIENLLRKSNFNYIEVTNFAYHISNYMKFDSDYLLGFLNINKDCISIKTSEAVKNLAKIVVSKNSIDDNKQLYYKLQSEAKIILSELFCGDLFILENIFKEVLLFDILLEIVKCKIQIDPLYYQEIIGSCIPVVTHMSKLSASEKIHTRLQIKDQVINDTNFEHMINSKTKKIMEAFLNNILQFIMDTLNYVDLKSVITFLSSIIESSNMRKPTTTSAQVLILASEKKYDDYTKNTDLENFKMLLLSEVLSKLLEVPSAQQLTIRRNPESRLIVHALCVSDKSAHKTTLKWVFRELLNILSNDHKDSTLSSSLNCVETLISDNTLYNDTFEFIPEVFLICVKMFDQKSWTVRNANIQLAKALIERFHGVLVGYNNRPKSIDDLFNIFPNLAVPFFQTLSKNPLTDSAIIVMQFFSESQFTKKVFDDDSLATIRNSFLRLFIQIIKNNSNHYGIFAVRSYVSLCIEEDIPIIIQASFALVNILDYKTLLNNFKDPSVTLKFVTEVFQYVNQATDTLENRTYLTYYVEEENSYVDRSTVNKIVLKFLFDYNKATSNDEWFEYYKTVTKDNKK
ncbi:hypothetical protein GWI33_009368 [Rhynchophorus ferrugineus]|uniref:DUF2428 domain-containing protein n=1 Tax=Rhynchophorus ferrugineus TaxID=354439 RepID=A0A834IRA9_RHYFE|nr:hypothetical protein GWI33_009368 [Rhynchophorus ferrugineus]